MRKTVLMLIVGCVFSTLSFAQVRQLSGKIAAAEDGIGLPGASLIYKGTNIGSNTDSDGNFKITVPDDGILVVSFVGYLTQEVPIGNKTQFDIKL